jgi:chemotaxis protein CheD
MDNHVQVAKVGIAEMGVVKGPNLIRTSGLGSCVGVVIYDLPGELAGLVHVMLPDSTLAKTGTINEAKYADTGIVVLLRQLLKMGAEKHHLKAKIAGGAQMFQFASSNDLMRIGQRNVEAVERELKKHGIPLVAKDVGGNNGRTIEFNPKTGVLQIRTVNRGTMEL